MLTSQTAELLTRPLPQVRSQRRPAATIPVPVSLQDRVERTSLRKLGTKEQVYCEGDPRTHVFQIEEGVAMIYRMLPDGRRQVVDFAYAGDFDETGAVAGATGRLDRKRRSEDITVLPVPASNIRMCAVENHTSCDTPSW